MKVQRVALGNHEYIWLVLGNDHLPIKPIEVFVRYLHYTEKSPDTILSYASHLKLFWQFLESSTRLWQEFKLDDFASFVHWLRSSDNVIYINNTEPLRRSERTINTILSAVASFYRYHNQLGNTTVKLTEACYLPANRHKSLLYHVFKHKPVWKRIISLKVPKTLPKTLKPEQIKTLLNACHNLRDKFLISLLFETGLRIGQALGLKHEDIKSWDNEIHVIYRQNNANLARNKSRKANILHVSHELVRLYSDYINTYPQFIETNGFVFINLQNNQPLAYGTVRKIFLRLSKRTGIHFTPHLFRHTHAIELMKHGWDAAWVQKRLGHANIQTTLDTYTHLDQDDLKKAFQEYQIKRKNGEAK